MQPAGRLTRVADFFKYASDKAGWNLKAEAVKRMAVAMQQARQSMPGTAWSAWNHASCGNQWELCQQKPETAFPSRSAIWGIE